MAAGLPQGLQLRCLDSTQREEMLGFLATKIEKRVFSTGVVLDREESAEQAVSYIRRLVTGMEARWPTLFRL